jgi:hypothetical protein
MNETKKTRLTGNAYDVARLRKKSDLLTARIEKLTKERTRYDKAIAAFLDGATAETTAVA